MNYKKIIKISKFLTMYVSLKEVMFANKNKCGELRAGHMSKSACRGPELIS